MTPNFEVRRVALECAVRIACQGNWDNAAARHAWALVAAEAFLPFLDPPPEVHSAAAAKRATG